MYPPNFVKFAEKLAELYPLSPYPTPGNIVQGEISEGLRRILNDILEPTDEARLELERYGISLEQGENHVER